MADKEGAAPTPQAAIHIELADATIKSINQKAGKVTYTIEVEPKNRATTLEDESSILQEGYRAQVVIEAVYEEPVEGDIDPRQGKLEDWSGGANGE